jgi:ABC-2 type transport system permease protein
MSTATYTLPTQTARPNLLRIFATEARYEFTRLLRTRAFSLATIGFPVMFYCLFGLALNRDQTIGGVSVAKYMLGCYAVFGALGAALFGVGVGLSTELAAGWLELKRASPMPPLAYLLAKCCSAMAFGVIIVSILCALGIAFGHVQLTLVQYASMLGLTLAGAIPFASMGLLMALLVPSNSAPGITNMIYLPMSFCSGLWLPIQMLPHIIQKIAPALPTYHLAQLMVRTLGYASAGSISSHWSGLIGFTLVMLGAAWIAFRRREQNS